MPDAERGAYADIHSVLCFVHTVPHDHGFSCHSTCPTCSGHTYALPPGEERA